ncbi:MAG: hypothetical protein JW967_10145 [Dehalococcoidales bacterium]|nr:hypothetical protein [Dehalococcoidales bacterium]
MKRILAVVIIIITTLILTLSLMGCNSRQKTVISDPVNGYRTITESNKFCSFTFEFSDFYKIYKPSIVTKNTMYNFVSMSLTAPGKTTSMILPDFNNSGTIDNGITYTPAYIDIHVSIDWGSASERLDGVIEDVSKWPSFELLERVPVTVSGFTGEQVVYVDTLLPFPTASGEQPLEITRAVYFNVGNDVWKIEACSEMAMAEQVKSDYEHVLQTFRLLE